MLPHEVDAQEWPDNLSQNINIYLLFRTNRFNKFDPFWALVNLVRENYSTDLMNEAHDILPDAEGCDNKEEEDACIVSHNCIDGIYGTAVIQPL